MSEIVEKLSLYLQYPFVRRALIVGVLIALSSSLLGVTLVLKRFSFIGDGLSHVAFGAMAVAAVAGLTEEMPLVLFVTVVSAVLLLRTGSNAKIKGDAAVAMISVGALAVGYLLMNIFSKSSNLSGDVCTTLFGSTSILTLSTGEVILCCVLSALSVALFVLFY
ncbi:MAG: metal ABC transporter permease, partial [Clostridia bacterium]|nr:metal ABC transporter permease [Clostridia bacterium]